MTVGWHVTCSEDTPAFRAGSGGTSVCEPDQNDGSVPDYVVAYPTQNDVGDSAYAPHVAGDPCGHR
jgi:hypothetical protein